MGRRPRARLAVPVEELPAEACGTLRTRRENTRAARPARTTTLEVTDISNAVLDASLFDVTAVRTYEARVEFRLVAAAGRMVLQSAETAAGENEAASISAALRKEAQAVAAATLKRK